MGEPEDKEQEIEDLCGSIKELQVSRWIVALIMVAALGGTWGVRHLTFSRLLIQGTITTVIAAIWWFTDHYVVHVMQKSSKELEELKTRLAKEEWNSARPFVPPTDGT